MLNVRDVVLGRVPDVLDRVVVGRVRRQENRGDALQQPAGLVEAGQGSGVVGAGVVRDDRDLAGAGFLLEQVRCEGRLPGVPVLLGRVRRDCSAGRGGRRGRTGTSSAGPRTVWCVVLSGAACGGSRPRARGGPQSCGVGLPALAQHDLDLGRRPGHASGDGFLVAVLVERVRAVRGSARTGAGAAGTKNPPGTRHRT